MKKSLILAAVAVLVTGASASAAPAPAAVPTVFGVTPAKISAAGGATVTITGANLTGVSTVSIGGRPASSVTVVSAGKITAIAPAGTDGAAPVAVTSPAGTSAASTRAGLTYRTPLGIDVSAGPVAKAGGGPLVLTVTGGSLGADAAEFAAERVTVTMNRTTLRPTFVDSQRLRVTVPASALEEAQFTVVHDTVAGEPATVALAPVVTSLSAKEDTVVGGRKVTVRVAGANPAGATGFTFGDEPATCTAKGAVFECVAPPADRAGPVWVSFTSAAGTPSRFTAASAFVYTD